MTMRRALKSVLQRLAEPGGPVEIVFLAEETRRWPKQAVAMLCEAKVLREIAPADSVTCMGCEERCWRPIEVLTEETTSAGLWTTCHLHDGYGPFRQAPAALRRWVASRAAIARFVGRALGLDVRDHDRDWRVAKLGSLRIGRAARLVSIAFPETAVVRIGASEVPLIEILTSNDRLAIDRIAFEAWFIMSEDRQSGGKRVQPSTTVREANGINKNARDKRMQERMSRLARVHPGLNKKQLAERLVRSGESEGMTAATIARVTRLPSNRARRKT